MAARRLTVEILGEARKLNTTLGQVDTRLGRFGKNAERAGKGIAAVGVGFAASKVVQGLNRATQAASDLSETTSKTNVVFGKSAGVILAFGKTSAKSVGLSSQAAMEAAATFGNLFVAMKVGQKPAADMSVGLVKLAGDLGSFNNVDPTQVLEDLRSGLVGEVEPLRKYGIALNAASVEQEAMRETGKDNVKQLTEADKVTARYNLILKNTKTAQGDFARTSGGLANQQRILNAEWKDAQASFGKALLPAMLSGVKVAGSLAGGFARLNEETHGFAAQAVLGAAGLAGVGLAVGKTVKFLNDSKTAWKALRAAKTAHVVPDKLVGDAELALAAKTKLAGDAAAVSGGKFKLLGGLGGVGLVGGVLAAFAAVGVGLKVLDDRLRKADLKKRISELGGDPAALIAARRRLGEVSAQLAGMADGTLPRTFRAEQALREEQRKLNAALAGFANEGTRVTDRTNLLGSQLDRTGGTLQTFSAKVRAATSSYRAQVSADKALHDQLLSSRDAILSQADAFEHGRRASAVKTRGVLADLRNEVATLKTWASDAQALIRRGMSPEAVRFLSEKGPQYLRAFASGGDKAIASFERLFKQRMVNSGNVAFNTTVGAAEAFRRMVEKANAETARIKAAKAKADGVDAAAREFRRFRNEANTALGGIRDRNVTVRVKSGFSLGPGGGLGGRGGVAAGGLIDGPGTGTSDTAGLFALSKGEVVVPAANVAAAGGPRAVAGMVGMRSLRTVRAGRMARGGLVGEAGDAVGVRVVPGVGSVSPLEAGARGVNRQIAAFVAAATRKIKDSAAGGAFGGLGGPGLVGAVIRTAARYIGSMYLWGGSRPPRFDCSGLMQWSFGQHGIRIPRVSRDQARGGRPGSGARGDLVFFDRGNVHHVGLVLGGRQMLNAPHTGARVRVQSYAGRSVNNYRSYFGAGGAGRAQLDQGGWLMPGRTLVDNNTGRPERVLPPGGPVELGPRTITALAEALAAHTHDLRFDSERVAAAVATGNRRLARRGT